MKTLKSRKILIGIISAVLVIVNDYFDKPISEEAILVAAGLLGSCIIGLAIADTKTEIK